MSSQPGYQIADWWWKMTHIQSDRDLNIFMNEYWYVWMLMGLVLLAMVIMNIALCIYFRRRKRPAQDSVRDPRPDIRKTVRVQQDIRSDGTFGPLRSNNTSSQFVMDALIEANKLRAVHFASPLKHNEVLSGMAQQWAQQLAAQADPVLQHSAASWRVYDGQALGENLIYYNGEGAAEDLSGQRMVNKWHAEASTYNYALESPQPETKNFTQLVWRDSHEVGFGRAKHPSGGWFGVGLFAPAGNVSGRYSLNVFQPKIN